MNSFFKKSESRPELKQIAQRQLRDKIMVYDCFPFHNELEVLEIRLHELDDVVDKFVLVESTRTFQNQTKPLYFAENKERYKKFLPKIEHIVVEKFPGFFHRFRKPRPWDRSHYQKNQVARALNNCRPDDVILISDVDEIPSAKKLKQHIHDPGIKVFEQMLVNYFFNYVSVHCPCDEMLNLVIKDDICFWRGTVMITFDQFSSFRKVRKNQDRGSKILSIPNGGWHFSFIGDYEKIRLKLDAWEHSKEKHYNQDYLKDKNKVMNIILSGEDLFGRNYKYKKFSLDDKFPEYLVKNKEKFHSLILG
jgi:beta-1,4-mannosyl-glycoprotein beta-1,4-N-acetylglucosaminyltransferase